MPEDAPVAPEGGDFYVPGLMDLSGYSLRRSALDEAWDEFVDRSEQGTVFSTSSFLRASPGRPSIWYCLKNNEIKAAVALTESPDGRSCLHSGLLVYSGIMFAPPDPKQSIAQVHSEQFRVTSFVVRELTETYDRIELATHTSFTDIRPFLWHNYGAAGPMFETVVRYTSYLTLDPPSAAELPIDQSAVYAGCNKSRRQEIRNAIKHGVATVDGVDIELFSKLYEKTFAIQGLTVPDDELSAIRAALANVDAAGRLRMFVAHTSDGTPGSVAAFGLDGKRGYYLYGANDPEIRAGHTGTAVMWDGFRALSKDGIGEVDLEGINSPKRGYFKLSFGGTITPYYILRLNTG